MFFFNPEAPYPTLRKEILEKRKKETEAFRRPMTNCEIKTNKPTSRALGFSLKRRLNKLEL